MSVEFRSTENRFSVSTHRTDDPTGLIKFRVTLTHGSAPVPETVREEPPKPKNENEEEEETKEGVPLSDLTTPKKDDSTIEIGWQEKIFSPSEVKKVLEGQSISDNISLSNKYSEAIKKKHDEQPSYAGSVIFTKVAEDHYIDPSEDDTPFYGEIGSRKPNELSKAVLHGEGHEEMVEVVRITAQTMHIFASIQCSDGTTHEELLGLVRAYPGGRIDVRPPFSNKQSPPMKYKFFTPTKELVTYTFEVIENSTETETPFEQTLLSDIKRHRAVFMAGQAGSDLSNPPEPQNAVRMFYRAEIATAKMDEAPGVAVEYQIKLPPGWNNEETSFPQAGCSQYAMCREDGTANINLPIDLMARCTGQTAPTLHITCHSYAEDGARIVEGYGSCVFPMTAGSHTVVVNTWRVRGTISEELRLMFLNSGLEQQAPVEVDNEPGEFGALSADSVMNKFGLHIVGTGQVVVRFNLAMQSAQYATRPLPNTLGATSISQLGSMVSRKSQIAGRFSEQTK